ncbi:hypothetical protein P4O66_006588 [Electrophorus voltai]|uniref:RRM domain-containing protein n=1 Tax=Electrophorus voltai TaxID=2609070 RepID=A0AAD8ZL01_9TELE|nr:hypothetical protein P4O66_006588 [Electrophorus voltai]
MGDPTMHRDCPLDCKVYVGNLGNNGNKSELERAFGYYGPLRSVWVARNPPGFAFVEFEDPRDATDAVRELDGSVLGTGVHLPPGADAHATTTAGEAHLPGADPPVGGASVAAAAGLSPETVEGRGLCPETGTTNHLDPFPDQEGTGLYLLLISLK